MTEPALKPCPHCGGKPKIVEHSKRFDGGYVVSVGCCARIIGLLNEAMSTWNTRAGETK